MATKTTQARTCIIIPAYNEGTVIQDVVKSTISSLKKDKLDADVVVVNDGSKDDTAEQAEKGGAIVINHILNSGAGGATSTGLSYAASEGYSLAVTMDADGQHLPEDVVRGIHIMKKGETDLLIGSRLIDATGMSATKRLGNKGLSLITFVLFGIKSTDSQSGLRLFSRKSLDTLKWKTTGYEFCSEMLWRAHQLKLVVNEYPIKAVYTDYSKAKGQNNWNAVNIIGSLLKRRLVEILG